MASAPASAASAKQRKPKKKNPFDVDYGAEVAGKYKWTQTENEVTVTVPLPAGTGAKQVACVIHSNKLTAGVKGQPPIIDGLLSKLCSADDSYWQLESGNCEITLVKAEKKVWWDSVFPNEATIDVSKIEGSRHLDSNLLLRLRREAEEKMLKEEEEEERLAAGGAPAPAPEPEKVEYAQGPAPPPSMPGGMPPLL